MSWLSKRAPQAINNPAVQEAAVKGAKAFGRWLFSKIKRKKPVSLTPPEGVPPGREPKTMPRVVCPACGRDVAITADGTTFYHRTRPGTRDDKQHRVRVSDGVEV